MVDVDDRAAAFYVGTASLQVGAPREHAAASFYVDTASLQVGAARKMSDCYCQIWVPMGAMEGFHMRGAI